MGWSREIVGVAHAAEVEPHVAVDLRISNPQRPQRFLEEISTRPLTTVIISLRLTHLYYLFLDI